MKQDLIKSIHSHSAFFGTWKISTTMSMEKERKGPAEDVLQKYAVYMQKLLVADGFAIGKSGL